MSNRKRRRALEKAGVKDPVDETKFLLKYDLKLPGGLLRSDHPAQVAGRLDADNEVDLTRGVFVKLLESFGFLTQERAVVGLLAALVNPFPMHLRGAIAYAIVQGQGLMVDTDMVEVCAFCEQEKMETVDLERDLDADACDYCTAGPDEDVHDMASEEWDHDFETPTSVMKDTTQHSPNCPTLEVINGEANPKVELKTWKEVEAIVILTPKMYQPLDVSNEKTAVSADGNDVDDEPPSEAFTDEEADNEAALVDDREDTEPEPDPDFDEELPDDDTGQ